MFDNINELISFIEASKRQEKKTSLDQMFSLCSLFNNPQDNVPFIHVGGTNGKGSTVTYLKYILEEAGFNVGSFISPYVICFNERISLNNNFISDDDLLKYGNMIIEVCEKNNHVIPPFFDFVSLIAFLYFKDLYQACKMDIAILEVGMGGIFDSTNVCRPLLSLITNVDYDHMSILGNTLEEIWTNKLGILKPNTPFLCFHSDYDYLVIDKAKKEGSIDKLKLVNKEYTIKEFKYDYLRYDYLDYHDISLHLAGFHQIENSILAIEAIKSLNKYQLLTKNIDMNMVKAGLLKANWPGRLEKVCDDPLIILDGAHNVDAITRLAEYIDKVKFSKPLRLVIAISANKEVEKMINLIENKGSEVIYTEFNYRRSDHASHLYNLSNHKNKLLMEDASQIVDYIFKDKDHVNILFGSLYFVSEMRKKLK